MVMMMMICEICGAAGDEADAIYFPSSDLMKSQFVLHWSQMKWFTDKQQKSYRAPEPVPADTAMIHGACCRIEVESGNMRIIDDRIIESRMNIHDAFWDVPSNFLLPRCSSVASFCHASLLTFARYYFGVGATFLPETVRRGPFLVRVLFFVLWPRTGRLRRCRNPRYAPTSI